jgi:hypothetical protein
VIPNQPARALVLLAIVAVAGCRRELPKQIPQRRQEAVAPQHPNRIASLRTTAPIETTNGKPEILVEVAVGDPGTVDAFMAGLLHQVLLEYMISPPETAELRVTLIGDLTAAQFAEQWRRQLVHEPALQFFMSKMTTAEVLHSTESGHTIDRASLLSAESPPTHR